MNQLSPFVAAMSVSDVEKIASAIARGGLFGSTDPYAVLTLCLLAQAEGQHPAVVFRDYHLIQGKPAKKAEAMLRDFVASGGKVEWHQLDDTCADASFSHPGGGTARIDWTMKRAQSAGLATAMWKKYPRQMLRSRVVSEGVRTVYPGATSGLYVPEEVADMVGSDAPVDAAPAQAMIEHNPQTGEVEPTPREPVPGISKIKERLRAFMLAGNKTESLDEFRALKRANKDDLKTIRDANHALWTGDGSEAGEGDEGFEKWMARRTEELTPAPESVQFQLLMSTLAEVETKKALADWLAKNMAVVDELDGAESRAFEEAYNARESAIHAMDSVSAG